MLRDLVSVVLVTLQVVCLIIAAGFAYSAYKAAETLNLGVTVLSEIVDKRMPTLPSVRRPNGELGSLGDPFEGEVDE